MTDSAITEDTNIIPFKKYRKVERPIVTNCSFCNQPLVIGKYVQDQDTTRPAICFECVESCNIILKEK